MNADRYFLPIGQAFSILAEVLQAGMRSVYRKAGIDVRSLTGQNLNLIQHNESWQAFVFAPL